jgi:hypothetical protein
VTNFCSPHALHWAMQTDSILGVCQSGGGFLLWVNQHPHWYHDKNPNFVGLLLSNIYIRHVSYKRPCSRRWRSQCRCWFTLAEVFYWVVDQSKRSITKNKKNGLRCAPLACPFSLVLRILAFVKLPMCFSSLTPSNLCMSHTHGYHQASQPPETWVANYLDSLPS